MPVELCYKHTVEVAVPDKDILGCMQTQASSERFVDEVEKRWGVKFPKGRNPDLNFMAHLWEPLR